MEKKYIFKLLNLLREEKKFNSVEELKATIANDVSIWRKKKQK